MAPRASKRSRPASPQHDQNEPQDPIPWEHEDNTYFREPQLVFKRGDNMTKTQFVNNDKYQAGRGGEVWNDTNKSLYNSYLRIKFEPTRVLDPHTLRNMGIYSHVTQMLTRIGLGTIPYRHYPLYKELAIQFFSSVELHHEQGFLNNPNRAVLSFCARGKIYRAHVQDIYQAFGLDTDATSKRLPGSGSLELWKKIGLETAGASREMKITTIRNPTIRIVAKVIGNLLMGKEEAGTLSLSETVLLHYGFSRDLDAYIYDQGHPYPPILDTSIGYLFLQTLLEKKTRALNMKQQKIEATANLLTPIFRVAGVPLDNEESIDTQAYMDDSYLRLTKVLVGDAGLYQYTGADGVLRCAKLPLDGFMSPDTPEGLAFDIPEDLQLPLPAAATTQRPARPSSSRSRAAPPPQPHSAPDADFGFDPYGPEYEFESPPQGASIEDRLEIIHRNQRREHSFNRKIWEVVSRWICGGGSERRGRRGVETSTSAAAARDEDADDEETDEDAPEQMLRHRARREPGQTSRSP